MQQPCQAATRPIGVLMYIYIFFPYATLKHSLGAEGWGPGTPSTGTATGIGVGTGGGG